MKIKIYTPEAWKSYFEKYPSLIIEDNYIYSEKDYYRITNKSPIGKIDESGYVYGQDYFTCNSLPVGRVVKDRSELKVYGDDYHKVGAKPILYVKEGQVFTPDEYFKLIPMPEAYIESEQTAPPLKRKKRETEQPTDIGLSDVPGVVAVILGIFALACSYGWLSGSLLTAFSKSELLIFLAPVFVAGMIAFFTVRGTSVLWCTVLLGGALSWICAAVYDLVVEGFNMTWILADLLLGWVVAFPYIALPALIWSIAIIIVQKILGFSRGS